MSRTFPPHGAANTQAPLLLGEATRRLQGWRCDLLKGDMSKSDPKRSKVLLRCSFSWYDLEITATFNETSPPEFEGWKETMLWQMCDFPWVSTSSRLSGGPGCLFLLRVSVGQWAETQNSAPQHPQALSNSQWPKHPKKPSTKNHVEPTGICHVFTNIPSNKNLKWFLKKWDQRTADS